MGERARLGTICGRLVVRWKRVAIVGVGLMGGSLGLALKKRQLVEHVVGVGRRKRSLSRALRVGACD